MSEWIKTYFRDIGQTLLLTPSQEVELAERIKQGDPEARDHMIRANLRLVVKIAQDYANYGLPLLDLISEGNIGLMKAVERFDPNKGGKLSTYAAWWIKQSIKRGLANQSKTIRLPVHMVDKISKMRRIALSMTEELGREPTDDELAEEIGIDRGKLAQMKAAWLRPMSLDAPVGHEDTTEFWEIIGDENAQTPLELLSHKNMHGQLEGLLAVLDDRERKIIDARFGLNGQKSHTLEEVGQDFGVTRERIRQLQNIALKKLARALQKKDDPLLRWISWKKWKGDKKTHRNDSLTAGFLWKAREQLGRMQSRISTEPIKLAPKARKPRTPSLPSTLNPAWINGHSQVESSIQITSKGPIVQLGDWKITSPKSCEAFRKVLEASLKEIEVTSQLEEILQSQDTAQKIASLRSLVLKNVFFSWVEWSPEPATWWRMAASIVRYQFVGKEWTMNDENNALLLLTSEMLHGYFQWRVVHNSIPPSFPGSEIPPSANLDDQNENDKEWKLNEVELSPEDRTSLVVLHFVGNRNILAEENLWRIGQYMDMLATDVLVILHQEKYFTLRQTIYILLQGERGIEKKHDLAEIARILNMKEIEVQKAL